MSSVRHFTVNDVRAGLLSARPAPSALIGFYTATDVDSGTSYYSNGTTWTQFGAGISATAQGTLVIVDNGDDTYSVTATGSTVLTDNGNHTDSLTPVGTQLRVVDNGDGTIGVTP